jgi:hypothetical protein
MTVAVVQVSPLPSGWLGWVNCRMDLASIVILGSESQGTHDNILLSLNSGSCATLLVKVRVMFQPTVSRLVCLYVKPPSRAQDQIFITAIQLRICWCGAPSLTRGRVCHLQLLLDLASTVILGSESHRTRDHILLSQIQDSLNLEHQALIFISPRNRVA